MSKVLITRSKLDGLATTIAAKSGATLPLTIAQMDAAVQSISGRGVTVEALSVTENGSYTAPSGTAYSPVTVSVPAQDSTLVVTLSYNESTEKWEPDCTYVEVQAAYQAGKNIVVDLIGTAEDGQLLTKNCITSFINGKKA